MPNDWKIKRNDVQGPQSGKLLDGCQIRRNEDGTVDFLGVLASTDDKEGYQFPPFVYRGLIWNLDVTDFDYAPDTIEGAWVNNAPKRPGAEQEEDGTYTAQAGSGGTGEDEDGKKDAASAYA
jgi:hypothetical protein